MPVPSGYDKQVERAWKGDYSAEPQEWEKPELDAKPGGSADVPPDREVARDQSRRQIESIVENEAVSLSQSEPREGRMKLAKFVKFREEKFGGVLFETRNEKVYTLNPTGAAVVREIVAGSSDVVATLKDRYEDKDGTIEAEARAFLEDLKTKGLVEA